MTLDKKIAWVLLVFFIGLVAGFRVNYVCAMDRTHYSLSSAITYTPACTINVLDPYSDIEAVINNAQAIELEKAHYTNLNVIKSTSAKTYEDYRLITCKSSPQYNMIYSQKLFTVRDDGFLVTEDGYLAVALGTYFGELGSKYIFITDTGNEIPVIKLDEKQDIHTDSYNFAGTTANDILEFVVDTSKMPIWKNGYCYGGNLNNVDWLNGKIVEIRVIK